MPDLGTLADLTLGQEQKSNARVDQYLDKVRVLLETTEHWSSRHSAVFDEMIREVRSSRHRAIGASVLFGLMVLLAAAQVLVLAPRERKDLVARLTNANLPLRFERGEGGQATAYYSSDSLREEAREVLRRAGLEGQPVGHYPGLGQEVPLEFRRDAGDHPGASALHWAISPQQRTDQQIGSLTINHSTGALRIREIAFKVPVAHNDLPHLLVRVESSSPAVWLAGEEDRKGTSYELRYGVMMGGPEPEWADQIVRIHYSPSGQILQGPFLVSDPKWPMAYSVVAAIGYWGSDPAPATAYSLQSIALELRLN